MDELVTKLEARRQAFIKMFKQTKTINMVVLGAFVVAMGVVFLVLLPANSNLGLIVIAVLLGGMFLYSRWARNALSQRAYRYIYDYYHEMDEYFYRNPPFSNLEIKENSGLDVDELRALGVLKNVTNVISRHHVNGVVNERTFTVCDTGVRVERDRKVAVAFYGRIASLELKEPVTGHYIIHRYFRDDAVRPDGFADFQIINEQNGQLILGTDNQLPKQITKSFIDQLGTFPLDAQLIDITAIIRENKVHLLFSYHDAIMNVGYEQVVALQPLQRYEDDLRRLVQLSATLK